MFSPHAMPAAFLVSLAATPISAAVDLSSPAEMEERATDIVIGEVVGFRIVDEPGYLDYTDLALYYTIEVTQVEKGTAAVGETNRDRSFLRVAQRTGLL